MRTNDRATPRTAIVVTFIALGVLALFMGGYPVYRVWSKEMAGKAALAEANQNRQIRIAEAKAELEAAQFLANAEVERAKGVAQANQIIGESLQGRDDYLQYLWVQNIRENQNAEVIYVPTEGQLPILEAGRALARQNAATSTGAP